MTDHIYNTILTELLETQALSKILCSESKNIAPTHKISSE